MLPCRDAPKCSQRRETEILSHLFLYCGLLLLVLSMPSSNQGWPEDFGFQLGGNGPSYILSVEEGSSAHLAGLQAGDQVLEIEGHNVSTLGPQAVIAIAQTQKNIPPSIGVVSRIQQVQHLFSPLHAMMHMWVNACGVMSRDFYVL